MPEKKVKGYVMMGKGEERFPEKVGNKDPFWEEQPITEGFVDLDKAIQATKPNVPVADFNRYEKIKEKKD